MSAPPTLAEVRVAMKAGASCRSLDLRRRHLASARARLDAVAADLESTRRELVDLELECFDMAPRQGVLPIGGTR